MPHRYFTTDIGDGQARLWGQDAHHLAHVMRARLGDEVILCDGNATEYTGQITGFEKDCVLFSVSPGYPSGAEPSIQVTLFVGYPKQGKLETIVQKAVELGAVSVVPFFSRYCVVTPKKEEEKNACYECGGQPLRRELGQARKIALITGSEGGFAPEEAQLLQEACARVIGLGPRILRCETAPTAALAALMTLTGNLE
mgnify:CR=1 FL=1